MKLNTPMLNHDVALWMGDLNFRVNGYSPDEIVERLKQDVDSGAVHELLSNDQLLLARKQRQVSENNDITC